MHISIRIITICLIVCFAPFLLSDVYVPNTLYVPYQYQEHNSRPEVRTVPWGSQSYLPFNTTDEHILSSSSSPHVQEAYKTVKVLPLIQSFFRKISKPLAYLGEGVALGLASTILHPIDTALNITAGPAMLAWQTSRILVQVLHIGVLHYTNPAEGEKRWHDFVHEIDTVVTALNEKMRDLSLRDVIKGAAFFATECYLQGKVVHSLGAFYQHAKTKVLKSVKDLHTPIPKALATTPEGAIVEAPFHNTQELYSEMGGQKHKKTSFIKQVQEEQKNSTTCNVSKATSILSISNMNEFFEKTNFGRAIKNKIAKTAYQYDGKTIYKVTEKIDHDYLKKGYHFYLDALHKDHLEVFDKNGQFKFVLNLDSTVNIKKTEMGLLERRRINI